MFTFWSNFRSTILLISLQLSRVDNSKPLSEIAANKIKLAPFEINNTASTPKQDSYLFTLGLVTHKAADETEFAKLKRKEEFAKSLAAQPVQGKSSKPKKDSSGTLETIVKRNRTRKNPEKRKTRMTLTVNPPDKKKKMKMNPPVKKKNLKKKKIADPNDASFDLSEQLLSLQPPLWDDQSVPGWPESLVQQAMSDKPMPQCSINVNDIYTTSQLQLQEALSKISELEERVEDLDKQNIALREQIQKLSAEASTSKLIRSGKPLQEIQEKAPMIERTENNLKKSNGDDENNPSGSNETEVETAFVQLKQLYTNFPKELLYAIASLRLPEVPFIEWNSKKKRFYCKCSNCGKLLIATPQKHHGSDRFVVQSMKKHYLEEHL